jgi:O-acetyl-ADP-ribose deacetylase (regulator of RNase III)
MGKLIERSGDLFDTESNILGHGVNIEGLMGAGIAKEFSSRFPVMYDEYKDICKHGELVAGETWLWEDEASDFIVLNIASQDKPGKHARLDWLESGLEDALEQLARAFDDVEVIALPRIGCGIGGLDWEDVRPVLVAAAEKFNVDIELWTY